MKTFLHLGLAWCVAILAFAPAPFLAAANAPFPYTEGFEDDNHTNYWTLEAPWAASDEAANSGGTRALSDSPGAAYDNSVTKSATLAINLPLNSRPYLSFWHRASFEADKDFGFVRISVNGGSTWVTLFDVTEVSVAAWSNVRIDLSQYAGLDILGRNVLLQFRMSTDAANRFDGWFLDDVEVKQNTRVMPYPFFDDVDVEGSETNWFGGQWKRVNGSAQGSGGKSWRMQRAPYSDSVYDTRSICLAGVLNLSTAVSPQLSFWFKGTPWPGGFQQYEDLQIEGSGNGGQTWTVLTTISRPGSVWSRTQVDLSRYVGFDQVMIRLTSAHYNGSYPNYPGDLQIDDIAIAEAPVDVASDVNPGPDPRHQAALTWSSSLVATFSHYEIYRSLTPNVTPSALLVTTISNRTTTSFLDTNLALTGTRYYYRVLVWNTNRVHNLGAGDLLYLTSFGVQVTSLPYVEDFEGVDTWGSEVPWGIAADQAHSGTHSMTDSPGTSYLDNASYSTKFSMYVPLGTRPYLSFWQRYTLEQNLDFGFVEVSTDAGLSWKALLDVTGVGGVNWYNIRVNLSEYVETEVGIRFRLVSNVQNRMDGWHIDDVEVRQNTRVMPYPFFDDVDVEGSETNWFGGQWKRVNGSAQGSGGKSWRMQRAPYSDSVYDTRSICLAGVLNLSTAVSPQLSFWFKGTPWPGGFQQYEDLRIEGSGDGGQIWTVLTTINDPGSVWSRTQVDLSRYVGFDQVMIRLTSAQYTGSFNYPNYPGDLQIDDILISEGAAHTVIFQEAPSGEPNPVTPGGTVQCNARAVDTWGYQINYTWECSGGTFQDTGTTTSANRTPVWVVPASPEAQYTLTVTATSSNDAAITNRLSFVQLVSGAGSPVATPTFSPPSGTVVPVNVTITTTTSGATIRYTIDGTEPTSSSSLYSTPISVTAATTLKARAFKSGMSDSAVATASYPATATDYHTADYRATFWTIDGTEMGRVLSYWRAGGYHVDAVGLDGYAPGAGSTAGGPHKADFRTTQWVVDGTEMGRVLSYWRAGSYHKDAAGLDGYAPGPAGAPASLRSTAIESRATQQAPALYAPGKTLTMSGTVTYSRDPLSVLWRPRLPSGWKVVAVSGDAAPELVSGEVVFTGKIPRGLANVSILVQAPADATGIVEIGGELELHFPGEANPRNVAIESVRIGGPGSGLSRIAAVERRLDGRLRLSVDAETGLRFVIEGSTDLIRWMPVATLLNSTGILEFNDTELGQVGSRFYRVKAER